MQQITTEVMSDGVKNDVLFPDLNPEDSNGVTEIESLCMHCYEQVQADIINTLFNYCD